MEDKVCHICGMEWKVEYKTREEDSILNDGIDGYCDKSARLIVIMDPDRTKNIELKNPYAYLRQLVRHEVIHAFLFESGLCENTLSVSSWSCNEEMVDWFAKQWPKINKTLEELCACYE